MLEPNAGCCLKRSSVSDLPCPAIKPTGWLGWAYQLAPPLGAVALHLVMIRLPFVNQETAFNQAATYFHTGDAAAIQAFFDNEANTLVVPALGALLAGAINIDPNYGCRLLSILCVALLALSLPSMRASPRRYDAVILQALVLLNPLVWTFSGRGTADFTPMALSVASIALFWRARQFGWTIIAAAIVFALAVGTKYHALLLLPLVALNPDPDQPIKFRATMLIAAGTAATIVFVLYNVIIHQTFGFWITPPKFAAVHAPTTANVLSNAVQYAGYLALLAFPLSFLSAFAHPQILNRLSVVNLAFIAAAFGVGLIMPPSMGEMNFGPFDRWIGSGVSGAALCALSAILMLSFVQTTKNRADRVTVAAIMIFLIVLSFSRPAQRYLLLILPFFYLHLARNIDLRKYAIPTLLGFIAINTVVAAKQFGASTAQTAPTVFGQDRRW